MRPVVLKVLMVVAVVFFCMSVAANIAGLAQVPPLLGTATAPFMHFGVIFLWVLIFVAGYALQGGMRRPANAPKVEATAPLWATLIAFGVIAYGVAIFAWKSGGGTFAGMSFGWGGPPPYGSPAMIASFSGIWMIFSWCAIAGLLSMIAYYRRLDEE